MAYPPSTLPSGRTDGTVSSGTHPSDHNNAATAINDIVAELGSNPSGAYADVGARFAAITGAADINGFLDAVAYGIDNTGTVDETGDINAFLTAAASQSKVAFFPPGTYRCHGVSMPANCHIRGLGELSVIKLLDSSGTGRVLRFQGNNSSIRDIVVDGNGTTNTQALDNGAIEQDDTAGYTGIVVDNVTVRNTRHNAIRIFACQDVRVERTRVLDFGLGGVGGTGIAVRLFNSTGPTTGQNYWIRHNYLKRASGNTTGYGILTRGSDDATTRTMRDVDISHNDVDLSNSQTNGLCIESWCPDTRIAHNNTRGGIFGISNGMGGVVITGNTVRDVAATNGLGIEALAGTWTAGTVACVGNTLTNVWHGIAVFGPNHDRVTIAGNVISGFKRRGIDSQERDVAITGNVLMGTTGADIGINCQNAVTVAISGNVISIPAVAGTYAIWFDTTEDLTVNGNVVLSADVGISLGGSSPLVLNGSIVGNNLRGATTKIFDSGTSTDATQKFANAGVTPVVTGIRASNTALADLLAELAAMKVIDDQTTAT